MAKLTLTDIATGHGSKDLYNANNALIEAALENTLSRDGTTPNTMSADFDMNSNDILNGGAAAVASLTIGGVATLPTAVAIAPDASDVTNTPAGDIVATDVQAAIDELDTEKMAKASNLSDVSNMDTTRGNIWKKGADIASATALALGTDGNYFDVTGTTTITSISNKTVGVVIKLHFDAILTLTHHATDLVLPGGANITTAAGDEAEFFYYATGDWRCTSYTKADGTAVVSASVTTKAEQTADHTILAADLSAHLIIPVDINTTGSVDITELALGSMSGLVTIKLETDNGDASARKVRLMTTGAAERWTGFQKGDFITLAYDGTNAIILAEKCTIFVELFKTANHVLGGTTTDVKTFNSNYSADKNSGGLYDTATNHRYDAPPFAGRYAMEMWCSPDNWASYATPELYIAGANIITKSTVNRGSAGEDHFGNWVVDVAASAIVEFYSSSEHATLSVVMGDAAEDESYAKLRLIERIR